MHLMLARFVASFVMNLLLDASGLLNSFFERDALVYVPSQMIVVKKPNFEISVSDLTFATFEMPSAEGTSKLLLATVVCLTAMTCAVIAMKQRRTPASADPDDDLTSNLITTTVDPIDKTRLAILKRPTNLDVLKRPNCSQPVHTDLKAFFVKNPFQQNYYIKPIIMPECNPNVYIRHSGPTGSTKASLLQQLFFNGFRQNLQKSLKF